MGNCSGTVGSMSTSFKCSERKQGAFLYLPFSGNTVDTVRTKAYETYIRKHCDSWIEFAISNDFDVRLEDIILVTGCDLTSSWAMATFVDSLDLKINLRVQAFENESATFQWSDSTQPHNNESNQVSQSNLYFPRTDLEESRIVKESNVCSLGDSARNVFSPCSGG
jgi:hypothetical protein